MKVQQVHEPVTVNTGKKKQDVTVADASATGRVTLWEEHVGKLQETTSYELQNFVVKEWDTTKYLSMIKDYNSAYRRHRRGG